MHSRSPRLRKLELESLEAAQDGGALEPGQPRPGFQPVAADRNAQTTQASVVASPDLLMQLPQTVWIKHATHDHGIPYAEGICATPDLTRCAHRLESVAQPAPMIRSSRAAGGRSRSFTKQQTPPR